MNRQDKRRAMTKGELLHYINVMEEQLHQVSVKFGMIEYNLSLRGLMINRETFAIEERALDDPLNRSPAAIAAQEGTAGEG